MAPVYADHPFSLVPTPISRLQDSQAASDVYDELASEMALVHNMIIRGLNSIYLQAPHIKPADEKSFGRYMVNWHTLIHSHHDGEEDMLFPALHRLTGVEGLMCANIEQHKAFHDGLEIFKTYADAVAAGEKYEGGRVVEIIDGFATALVKHLGDEIPTIVGLRQYDDKLAELPKLFQEEAEKTMVSFVCCKKPVCLCVGMIELTRNRNKSACWVCSKRLATSTPSMRTADGRAGHRLRPLSRS